MKILEIFLLSLLCWSFVSSIPHHETSNVKTVDESNNVNDSDSDSSNLTSQESLDDASSGKNRGGKHFNLLTQKDLNDIDNDQANKTPFLVQLIHEGFKAGKNLLYGTLEGIQKLIKVLTLQNKSNVTFDVHYEKLSNNSKNKDTTSKEPTNINEETEKKSDDRAKRDLDTSRPLRSNRHKRDISEHVLNLSKFSKRNVLKPDKATLAEALNGRAIRKILALAQARVAKNAKHKKVYDNDEFKKWLLSTSSFDSDDFNRIFQPSFEKEPTIKLENYKNIDDSHHHKFSKQYHPSMKSTYRNNNKKPISTTSDFTADSEDNGDKHSNAKLLHKSQRLSSKSQITSGEGYVYETNEMPHKPTIPHHMHRSLSHEDEENTGQQYVSSYAHRPHMHFSLTEDEEMDNDIPKWHHIKWSHIDPSETYEPYAFHFEKPWIFETSEEGEEYDREWLFKMFGRQFGQETDDEEISSKDRMNQDLLMRMYAHDHEANYKDFDDEIMIPDLYARKKLDHERYRHYDIGDQEISMRNNEDAVAFDNMENQYLAKSQIKYNPIDPSENIRNGNRYYNLDDVHRSTLHFTTSAEAMENDKKNSARNILIETSADTPMWKSANIDIGHHHFMAQNVATEDATLSMSSRSKEKQNENIKNVVVSPSIDDESATVKEKIVDDYSIPGRTHSAIDNNVKSKEIEMGFSKIKNHVQADLSLTHSSQSHARSGKTHLENQKVHHGFDENQQSTSNAVTSTKTRQLTDKVPFEHTRAQKNLSTNKDEGNVSYQKDDTEINMRSAEMTSDSMINKNQKDTSELASSNSGYIKIQTENENKKYIRENPQFKHSAKSAHDDKNTDKMKLLTNSNMEIVMEGKKTNNNLKENQEANIETSVNLATSINNEHQHDSSETILLEDSREKGSMEMKEKYRNSKERKHNTPRHRTSIEVIDINDGEADILTSGFAMHKFRKGHGRDNTHYRELNDRQMFNDQKVESAQNEIETYGNYNEQEEQKFDEITEQSKISKEYDYYNDHNENKKYKQHNEHREHNQHNHFQAVNHLYPIRKQKSDESSANIKSSISAIKKSKKQNNSIDEEMSLSNEEEGKGLKTERGHIYLEEYEGQSQNKLIKGNTPASIKNKTKIIKTLKSIKNHGEEVSNENEFNSSEKGNNDIKEIAEAEESNNFKNNPQVSLEISSTSHSESQMESEQDLNKSKDNIIEIQTSDEASSNNRKNEHRLDLHKTSSFTDTKISKSKDISSSKSSVQFEMETENSGHIEDNEKNTNDQGTLETIISNDIKDDHLQKSSSTSSKNSETNFKHYSSEPQNNYINNINTETQIKSVSLNNKHNSNDWIEKQNDNIADEFKLGHIPSPKSHTKSKAKIGKHYFRNINSRSKHVLNTEETSKSTNSAYIKDELQPELQNTLSFSKSSADSQMGYEYYSDNVEKEKSINDKNKKDEIFKENLENLKKASSIELKEAWIQNELDSQKRKEITNDNFEISYKIPENDKQLQNNLLKKSRLPKFEKQAQEIPMSSSISSHEKIELIDKTKNKSGETARDSVESTEFTNLQNNKHKLIKDFLKPEPFHDSLNKEYIETEINSGLQANSAKDAGIINEIISMESAASDSFNSERRNSLKVTTLDNLHAEMSRENKIKNRNNKNRQTNIKTAILSSPYTEPMKKEKKTATQTEVTAESYNSDKKDAHEYDFMQEKSLFRSPNVVVDKEHIYCDPKIDMRNIANTRVSAEISISDVSPIEHQYDEKNGAMQQKQDDLNIYKKDNTIASNALSSTKETSSSGTVTAENLSKSNALSNFHTEEHYENFNDIEKNNPDAIASGMISSKKSSGSQESIIKDSSNSYAESQIESGANISQDNQINGREETSKEMTFSNNHENVQRKDLRTNLFSDLGHNMYVRNKNSNALKNKLENSAEATKSAKETSYGIIRDKSQYEATKTTSLQNSHAQTQADYVRNLNVHQQSMDGFNEIRNRQVERQNVFDNPKILSKLVRNRMALAERSSSGVEDINRQDPSKMLSVFDSYADMESQNVAPSRHRQEIADLTVSAASKLRDSHWERRDNLMKGISHAYAQNPRVINDENDNTILKSIQQNDEDVALLEQATSIGNVKNERDDSLEVTSFKDSFADRQVNDEYELDVLKKKHLITNDSTRPSHLKTSGYMNNAHKNNLKKLIAMLSNNSYTKSRAEDKNLKSVLKKADTLDINTLAGISNRAKNIKGLHSITIPSDIYAEKMVENGNIDSLIQNRRNDVNLREEVAYSADAENTESFSSAEKMMKMIKDDQHNQQEYLYKTMTSSDSAQDNQYLSENYLENKRLKEDQGIIAKVSSSAKTRASGEMKKAHRGDWMVTTANAIGDLAEERTQNKEKFNVLKKAEKTAAYAEASAEVAASGNIGCEQHHIQTDDPNNCQANSNIAKEMQDAAAISGASSKTVVSKSIENKSIDESILNDKISTSSSIDARAEIEIKNKKDNSDLQNLKSSIDTKETRHSSNSAVSSVYAENFEETDMDRSKMHDQISNKILDIHPTMNPGSRRTHLSSVGMTSLQSSSEHSCDDTIETREFISEATNLHQIMNRQRDTEVLLIKKHPEGSVQIASFKNSIPPLIKYRLIPQEVYERIRMIIANKQIFCIDCPFANIRNK